MKWLLLLPVLLCACLHDPYEAPANYAQDSVYCYRKDAEGKWHLNGLARQCPPNTKVVDSLP